MKKKRAGINELLATYSSHVSSSYPSPEDFRWNLDQLLDDKKGRLGVGSYSDSLERNLVFLHDLILEGEALLDMLFKSGDKEGRPITAEMEVLLKEMEGKVRERTADRHREVFGEGKDAEFTDLYDLKRSGDPAFLEKLEFNYRYLMTLRVMLFEFFNVLLSVESGYHIFGSGPTTGRDVFSHIELTANYYIANIKVRNGTPGDGPSNQS